MTPIFKDPDAVLSYTIAWPVTVLDGAAIASADWTVEPDEPGGIAAAAPFIDGGETGAQFSGGVPGQVYRARCQIALSDGRSDDGSVVIRVEER
ncbi:phage fiber-tail adaptor protein [Parasphingopyxis marina]|uniref:Uncharacterized protein n=1 Tax=Parasphingopyxis marina TaxID=2761622 RepID=A0A842HYT5_9SPHN|nr:hypothetical protein [Parasphingopyxis marina]MBC2778316.1 hypothetical protein [Parasphingopyxis marina]